MSYNKLLIPAALGLSIVTVTALVVYYIFKEEEENKENSIKTSRVNTIEISVPKSIVPALIGRNGSNIKEIEKKSGATIHFKKFNDKDFDVCIIRGRSMTAQLAETLIHDFINNQPVIIEDRMMVPGWACGRIIGTGGENINEISHRSGARIKIEGGSIADRTVERNVSFRGTKEQIKQAKELIDSCVAQEKCRREIEQSKRSPRIQQANITNEKPKEEHKGDKKPYKAIRCNGPEAGSAAIEVYVSAVSSPSRFWVQFVGPQVAQLDDLVTHMTEYYGSRTNREAHQLTKVSIGQVVAAVFRYDGRWYRARVHDIRPNEFDATQQVADVFFVDYGDSEYVATHELCELRADLLRLRFQAMECFLAGVKPANKPELESGSPSSQKWDGWPTQATEKFEELTHVAKWKPLLSRTCTYKKTGVIEGEQEKEIPGIKLYNVTEDSEEDISEVLISEGLAAPASVYDARAASPRHNSTPFGDLGNSRVLGMVEGRSSSMPKDHKDDTNNSVNVSNEENITTSKSISSGMEKSIDPISVSNFNLCVTNDTPQTNGSTQSFLTAEIDNIEKEGSSKETLVPKSNTPILGKTPQDEAKANMNRIDSHHNLDALNSFHNDHSK